MELVPKDIPIEFLQVLPEGIKLVSRKGHPYLVLEKAEDKSGNSIIDDVVHIHGEPSVKLKVRVGNTNGYLFVDSYWGSHSKLYSFIPDCTRGVSVEAFSPIDGSSLMVPWECPIEGCHEKNGILLTLPGGQNSIIVCGKLGCPGHDINVTMVADGIRESISNINYFGHGEDDPFSGF